jgi:hypothetical protein
VFFPRKIFELFLQHIHLIAMTKCCLFIVPALFACLCLHAQTANTLRFRVGATIAFGLSHIAHNGMGVGGEAGVEKPFSKLFSAELEAGYTYFTGDEMVYPEGNNKAWAIPLLAGARFYAQKWLYAAVRAGAICFTINSENSTHIRPAYGIAAGVNLPEKNNRLNIQLQYTGFRYAGNSRGYATLAAAIIIN